MILDKSAIKNKTKQKTIWAKRDSVLAFWGSGLSHNSKRGYHERKLFNKIRFASFSRERRKIFRLLSKEIKSE